MLRYSDEELLEFKELISDKLATARLEVEFLREQIAEVNESGTNQQAGLPPTITM